MTLEELIIRYKDDHGNFPTWYAKMLDRFLQLNSYAFLRMDDEEEHVLLWHWVDDMVVAGVKATRSPIVVERHNFGGR